MKLYFENSYGRRHLIDEPETKEIAMMMIYQFCGERNFKIYYVRNWIQNGELVYDVGSHSEFFYLSNDDGAPMTLEE